MADGSHTRLLRGVNGTAEICWAQTATVRVGLG